MREGLLLSAPAVVTEISFSASGPTYVPSDMGPDTATWPHPVVLLPAVGIWMVDPGPERSTWRLLRFSMQGQKTLDVPLPAALGVAEPRLMSPLSMAVDRDQNVFLVASRSFDFDAESPRDYVRAKIDAQGKLGSVVDLPAYDAATSVIVNEAGTVFSRVPRSGKQVWRSIEAGGEEHKAGTSPLGSQAVSAGGRLLERIDAQTFRDVGDESVVLKLRGEPSVGTVPVAGDADIFGFVRLAPVVPDLSVEGGHLQVRELEVLKLDLEKGQVLNLGRYPLAPNRTPGVATKPFVLHRAGQARFDAQGNLFDISWQAGALQIYVLKAGRPG